MKTDIKNQIIFAAPRIPARISIFQRT